MMYSIPTVGKSSLSRGFRSIPTFNSSSKTSTLGMSQQHLAVDVCASIGQQYPVVKPAATHAGCFSQSLSARRVSALVRMILQVELSRRDRVFQKAASFWSCVKERIGGHWPSDSKLASMILGVEPVSAGRCRHVALDQSLPFHRSSR